LSQDINPPAEKSGLHPRNPHRFRYDFKTLIKTCPELSSFVSLNKYKSESIDFANPEAVKMLNRALLKHFYTISYWDIPENYLCPPIPGRADYIHYIADLLASCNEGEIPKGKNISVLDIGIGANCVYPIIGHKEYGWKFVGTDIDPLAIGTARKIVDSNESLKGFVECRQQKSPTDIFFGVIKENEKFDVSVCNPPFHASREEAQEVAMRKQTNLGYKKSDKTILNFGGQDAELWTPGGELEFVTRMIEESAEIPETVFWFSTIISKSENLQLLYRVLERVNAFDVKKIEMSQGQKISRILAWTFLNKKKQKEWKGHW
jgi:23S rRNA (adenine1618-N6)-methyltransferase